MLDLAPAFAEIVKWSLLLGLLSAIFAFLKSPRMKGFFGEKMVEMAGKMSLDPDKYIQFHDLLLRDQDGSTTQIDHVILSPYGIFVIETKNYKGWIFGSENDARWTQKLYRKKHTFQNPLRQNYRHIKVLSKLLGIVEEKFRSVVVFSGECEFKTPMPSNIVKGLGFINYIKSYNTPVVSWNDLRKAAAMLKDADMGDSKVVRKEHVSNLKVKHKKEPMESSLRCSRCGGGMVVRKNRNTGEKFLGCENYPKCRKTMPLEVI